MSLHTESHPLAGQFVSLKLAESTPAAVVAEMTATSFRIEDWQDIVFGKSWMDCDGNPACLKYAIRSGFAGIPPDNDVVYGKVDGFGHIVHVSELGEVAS